MLRFQSAALTGVVHANGQIQRIDTDHKPSDAWVCTGGVEFRFGRIARRYTLAQLLAGEAPFTYKHGKQRVYLTAVDHGTHVIMMSPAMHFSK